MDSLKHIVSRRAAQRNKNIHSEAHYWADVISRAFAERNRFAMYLGVIKRIGIKKAQKIFSEVKESSAKSPGKLFIWKAGKKKTAAINK